MACISAACQVTVDLLHESPYWDKNIKPEKCLFRGTRWITTWMKFLTVGDLKIQPQSIVALILNHSVLKKSNYKF